MAEEPSLFQKNIETPWGNVAVYTSSQDPVFSQQKPPLLLIHGWIASHYLFHKVIHLLEQQGIQTVAMDLLGFGESEKPSPELFPYHADAYADVVHHVTQILFQKNPYVLLAQSMGGLVGIAMATRYAESIRHLILLDSAGVKHKPPVLGQLLQLPWIGEKLFYKLGTSSQALRNFLQKDVYYLQETYSEHTLKRMQETLQHDKAKAAAYATLKRMLNQNKIQEFSSRFQQISLPTSLIFGEFDKLFPVDPCMRTMHQWIPHAQTYVIARSGHEPPMDQPVPFVETIQTIYKTLQPS